MERAKLPEARIEPRGVSGHVAQLKAEVRERARVAGAVGAFLARVVGWTAFAGGTVAVLVWLAPPPRSPRLDEIRRLQDDFARTQVNMEQARRAMEQMERVNQLRAIEGLQQYQVPVPARNADLGSLRPPTYDIGQYAGGYTDLSTIPDVASPATLDSSSHARAAKAERAAERVRAIEEKRATRTPR